jgi:1,4-dihydroxy-2-naphthoate octaprenyltransferase
MEVMKEHIRLLTRPWMLPVAIVALIAGHGIAYYVLRHTMLSATVVSGVIVLVVKNIWDCSARYTPYSGGDLGSEER